MGSWSRALACLVLMSLVTCALPDDLSDARRVFLNLYSSLYIKAVDVRTPPDSDAPWAVRMEWEQAPGCPDWGNLGIGVRAENPDGYAFDVYVESAEGPAALGAYLTEADGDRWVSTVDVPGIVGKGWQHVDLRGDALGLWQFGNGKREPGTIGGITFEASGHESKAVYWIANIQIHTRSGLRHLLPLMLETDCPPPTGIPPAVRLPAEPRVYMGMGMSWFVSPDGQEFVARARERVPNLGVACVPTGWRAEDQAVILAARQAGIDVRTQNAGTEGMRGLITKASAWGTAPSGESRNTTPGFGSGMHGVSYCHPSTREAVRRLMATQRGFGILDYEQIDYVWPWFGGPWGYGEWDIAAFRTDLEGLDEGLRLADGERCSFWDYLGAYGPLGLRPEDAGLTGWDQFDPAVPEGLAADQAARRRLIFVALTHYEWLKFAQAMGAEARSWGGQFLASMNPEDVSNGGDYLFWNRLADTGAAYYECFGNPAGSEHWRHALPYLRDAASQSSKRMAVIFEVGVGGHGRPYLDPEVAYCWAYDVVAAGQFDDMQNEWMGEGNWAQSQEGYHRDRLDAWLATARGFNQAKADDAVRLRPRVLAIGHRCVVNGVGYSPSYLLTRSALDGMNVDCDFADLAMDPAQWAAYDVLVYTPWESAPRHLEALTAWLDARPGRLLITHGAVPTRLADGRGFLPTAELGDGSLGHALGLGTISIAGTLDGTVTAVREWTAEALSVGDAVRVPGSAFGSGEGVALAQVGGKALVTELHRANGSRLVYLNYAAGQPETQELDRSLLGAALASAGCEPVTDTPGVYCHTYKAGPGTVAVLWSTAACDRFKFEYRGDIEQRMPYLDDSVEVAVRVSTPAGSYRVLDWLGHEETLATVQDGAVTLSLTGRSCALFYFGPDTPQWQEYLDRVRKAPLPGTL